MTMGADPPGYSSPEFINRRIMSEPSPVCLVTPRSIVAGQVWVYRPPGHIAAAPVTTTGLPAGLPAVPPTDLQRPAWERRLDLRPYCLEGMSTPSGAAWQVWFLQIRPGARSGESGAVRLGYGRWNDAENDTAAIGRLRLTARHSPRAETCLQLLTWRG
jgi:hypothetical protein